MSPIPEVPFFQICLTAPSAPDTLDALQCYPEALGYARMPEDSTFAVSKARTAFPIAWFTPGAPHLDSEMWD
jgi:hypothetical protein